MTYNANTATLTLHFRQSTAYRDYDSSRVFTAFQPSGAISNGAGITLGDLNSDGGNDVILFGEAPNGVYLSTAWVVAVMLPLTYASLVVRS